MKPSAIDCRNRSPCEYVARAVLDPAAARLGVVDAADAVAARELIEGSDQVDELEPPTLEGRRLAAFEMDRRVRGLVRRGGRTRRPVVDFLRWLDPRILEDSAFDRAAPEVLGRGIRAAVVDRDRDPDRKSVV